VGAGTRDFMFESAAPSSGPSQPNRQDVALLDVAGLFIAQQVSISTSMELGSLEIPFNPFFSSAGRPCNKDGIFCHRP